ncbi:peptidase [Actinomyces oris]|uniref:Peptidase n=2 Tax=Actinomyces oris TaxID=544580 RepID=A0A1Q8XDS5_9ACTO|nr:peptidase [Actinomyces oris]
MLTVLPMQARAAINPKITVSDLSLTPSNAIGEENPSKTAIQSGDYLKLKFSWDASKAQAKGGDSFEIALPEQVRSKDKVTEPMMLNHDGVSTKVGECSVAERKITCTFNSELDKIVAQGFKDLRGNGTSLVVANGASDLPNLSIKANGVDTPVAVPGGKIGAYVEGPYKPEKVTKWASDLTADSDKIAWQLIFGPDQIKAALEENGQSLTVDGKTRSTIMFTDELGPGQKYVADKSRWTLETGTSEGKGASSVQLTDAAGTDQNTSAGDFDLDVTFNGDVAFVKVTGPFAPRSNYIVRYESTPNTDNGKVQPGVRYKNDATALGTSLRGSYAVHYASSFSINVEMKPGFGGFEITKLLTGTQTGKVPADTTFKVSVNYDLPGDAKASAYPGWKAPGTLNQEGTGGDLEMTLNIGAKTVFKEIFPTGTVLTFNEDPTNASATPEGVVWGKPAFMVNGQSASTATIADQELTPVTLSNSADAVPVDHGDFTITKALAGDGDFSNSTFLFTYSCTDSTTGFLMVKGGKTSEHSEEVQAGSTCTVTEVTDSAFRSGYTLTAPQPQTVAIAKDQTAEVTMTNTYTKAKGSFSVTNSVEGAEVGDKEFTFTYTCDNGQEGTLKAKANGPAVNGPELPVGTECTIQQDVDKAQVDGYTLKAPASQKVTIGEKVLDLKFAGMYASLNVPTPSAEATAKPSAEATAKPSAEPSAAPSAAPADKPAADASADPNAKPSAEASAKPSAEASADPADKPAADASADPNAKPSAEATAEPSAAPSAAPADKPAADANADPNAKPSAEASADPADKPAADATATPSAEVTTEPTATPTASASSDVSGDPNADVSGDPNAKPSADASSSTAAGDSSSSGAAQQVTPTSSAAPAPADGAPGGPAGGPLASTGVRIGLPLGIAVVAVMGGALLVSRRRA